MKKSVLILLGCVSCLVAVPTANAIPIVVIDIGSDATSSGNWTTNYTSGYTFTVAANNSFSFNALALFDVISATPLTGSGLVGTANTAGLANSHQVGVWNAAGTLLSSATVSPGNPTAPSASTHGNWVYTAVTPTTLSAGTYTIGAYYAAGSDPRMLHQSIVHNNVAGVTYVQGIYATGSSLTRPTILAPLSQQAQYFGPAMLQVPDGGATIVLLGLAMSGIALGRRKLGLGHEPRTSATN